MCTKLVDGPTTYKVGYEILTNIVVMIYIFLLN